MNSYYEKLINDLISENYLKTPEIIEAFKNIDRADFVLDEYKNEAYVNAPLPIGFGQTISQPLTVAFMMELLRPKAGEKILDVGTGSGWQTAILAHITSKKTTDYPEASVSWRSYGVGGLQQQNEINNSGSLIAVDRSLLLVAIERIPELKEMAEKNISKYNFIEKGIVKVVLGDGSKGYKKEAPYDKIIAAAASIGDVPKMWMQQLKIGGRIVAPVGNSIVVIDKIGRNKYSKKEHFGFSFVPLIENKNI